MRYKITFSYKGTNFHGYQKQPGLRTVQDEVEKALTFINNGTPITITSSGRTDKGVHALGQVAHFDLDLNISLYKLKCAINSNVSDDIHIINVEQVEDDFHARYMVSEKKYIYKLNMGEFDVLQKDFIYQYNNQLDISKMKEGIKYFIGEHNFKNFVSDSVIKDSYVRTIYDAYIEISNNIINFVFIGNGFMQYQVRNMVGTLIKVGRNKIESKEIKYILENEEKKNLVYCAPALGLCLEKVKYEKK